MSKLSPGTICARRECTAHRTRPEAERAHDRRELRQGGTRRAQFPGARTNLLALCGTGYRGSPIENGVLFKDGVHIVALIGENRLVAELSPQPKSLSFC